MPPLGSEILRGVYAEPRIFFDRLRMSEVEILRSLHSLRMTGEVVRMTEKAKCSLDRSLFFLVW